MDQPIEMPFGLKTRVGRRKHKFNCICQVAPILVPPGNYNWTIRLLRRCGLMSNYFDHLFIKCSVVTVKAAQLSSLTNQQEIYTVQWKCSGGICSNQVRACVLWTHQVSNQESTQLCNIQLDMTNIQTTKPVHIFKESHFWPRTRLFCGNTIYIGYYSWRSYVHQFEFPSSPPSKDRTGPHYLKWFTWDSLSCISLYLL